jgi:hypothetical protein
LFESAGIRTESYIEWWDADLRGEGWRQAVNRSSRDAEHEGFAEILPECSRTERKKLLEVLYVDATTAAALHVPFSSDPVVRRFAEWGIRHALAPFGPDPRLAVYQRWVSICIPDFSVASWAEIHDLRESAAGKDLRATLQRVADRVAIELPNLQTEADVDDLLAREYVREVTEAAVPRTPAAARAARAIAIDLGLNWLGIPPLGSTALAAASEVFGILRERRQWISLLDWEPSARRSRPLRIGLREP